MPAMTTDHTPTPSECDEAEDWNEFSSWLHAENRRQVRLAEAIYHKAITYRSTLAESVAAARLEVESPVGAAYLRWLMEAWQQRMR